MQDLIFMIYDKWEAYCERAFWLGRKGHKKKTMQSERGGRGAVPLSPAFFAS